MKNLMTQSLLVLASFTVLLGANLSFAGCGAVVCTQDNRACTYSQGNYRGGPYFENRFDIAIASATNRCEAEYGVGNCVVKAYECNECTAVFTTNSGSSVQACY